MTAARVPVRPCRPDDLEQFGAFGSKRQVEYCRAEFGRSERVAILVAVSGGTVVGKIHVHFEPGDTVMLEGVSVVPELQRRGIGGSLIEAAENLALERGYAAVQLGVEDSNPAARRLYERLGYRSCARMEFRYEGAPVPNPGVMMRKALA